MKHSAELGELAKALAKAQGEMENAKKGNVNPHFKSKYADLGSVWDAIREPLSKNGLSAVQLPEMDEQGRIHVCTILLHESGQFIEASYALPATKNDAQGFGSAITYMKRYALTGMGVAPEDDDGNLAVKGPVAMQDSMAPQGIEAPPTVDKKAAANLWGNNALKAIDGFRDAGEFSAWHKANANWITGVRGHNEALHKRLIDAIAKKNAFFAGQPIASAAE